MKRRLTYLVATAVVAVLVAVQPAGAQSAADRADTALPDTGGPALLLPAAGALLLGSGGVLGVRALRRDKDRREER